MPHESFQHNVLYHSSVFILGLLIPWEHLLLSWFLLIAWLRSLQTLYFSFFLSPVSPLCFSVSQFVQFHHHSIRAGGHVMVPTGKRHCHPIMGAEA